MDTLQTMPEPVQEQRPFAENIDQFEPSVLPPSPLPPTPLPTPPMKAWPPFHKGRLIGLAAVVLAICAIAVWQIGIIRRLFGSMLPYAPVIFPSVIALGTIIFKDWKNYEPRWVRWVLIVFVVGAGAIGVAYQHGQREEKVTAERISWQNIEDLKGQVSAAQQAQAENTKQFLGSLQKLSDTVSDLKTKVTTEALRTELASVQGELKKTQAALVPAPKAELTFSFVGFKNPKNGDPFVPLREITVTAAQDGTIKVPIALVNTSEADAMQGHANIFVCDDCKITKEPAGMTRLPGMAEQVRDYQFQQILRFDTIADIVLELTVPRRFTNFQVGVQYRCRTCILQKEVIKGIVNVIWP
jgi:hypothetical protein